MWPVNGVSSWFWTSCHRRRELSPSDLSSMLLSCTKFQNWDHLDWCQEAEKLLSEGSFCQVFPFPAFSWLEIFYNSKYSSLVCFWAVAFALVAWGAVEVAVARHGLCARQGWPLLASRFKCSSVSQCLGAEELCFFLVLGKGPETCGSQARHSWELLWTLCCGCPGCWRDLEILSPLQRVSSPHVWGNLLQLFSQPTL